MEKKYQKGLTIIETVIATSIFVVASIIIVSLFISQSQLYRVQLETTDVKIYKTHFSNNFKEVGASASAIESSWTINGTLRTTSSSTVVFKLPSLDANNDIISNTYDYISFYQEGDTLFIETEANIASTRKNIKKLLSQNVETSRFRYNNTDPISATTITALIFFKKNKDVHKPLTETVKLRNIAN